jgi:hypothetical protein
MRARAYARVPGPMSPWLSYIKGCTPLTLLVRVRLSRCGALRLRWLVPFVRSFHHGLNLYQSIRGGVGWVRDPGTPAKSSMRSAFARSCAPDRASGESVVEVDAQNDFHEELIVLSQTQAGTQAANGTDDGKGLTIPRHAAVRQKQ